MAPPFPKDSPAILEGGGPLEAPTRRRRRRAIRGRSGTDEAATPADRQVLAASLLAMVVIGSVLAIGALHLPVLLVVAALAFASAGIALHRRATAREALAIPLPAVVCLLLAVYTLVQVVPMPIRWLAAIAPATADVWERCLLPFGEAGPRWASISLDPGASLVEALKWTTYAAVMAASAAIAARRGAALGVGTVFTAAIAAALVTLGHGLAGATRVYGLYQPSFGAIAWHIGPLLNPNNLAGYLNLGALAGLGLMLSRRPLAPRWLIGLGVALVLGIDVTSASRGGVLALPIGVFALAYFARRTDDRQPIAQSPSTWMVVLAVAGGGVLAVLGGTSSTWTELYDKNLSKLDMILWAKPLLRDHGVFGIGRGAFESVFPVYRSVPGNVVYTHAENFVVQWVSEWGVPVGLAALGAFAWSFAPRRIGASHGGLAAGAWCGVLVLLVQNMVDLALEVPAVCIGAAAVLGSLWGDRRRSRSRDSAPDSAASRDPSDPAAARTFAAPGLAMIAQLRDPQAASTRARVIAVGVAAAGVALAIPAVAFGWRDVASDRRAAREALDAALATNPSHEASAAARASLSTLLHRAMIAHPAEPYFPLVGGMAAFRTRSDNPIPWIQRTLERGQVNGRAHLLLAEVLAGRGTRKQALLELRLALEADPSLSTAVGNLAVHWTHSFDELLTAVPDGKDGARVLAHVAEVLYGAQLAGKGSPALADFRGRCDREAIQRDPRMLDPHIREANVRIDALEHNATSICPDRVRCRDEVLEHASAILAVEPDSAVAVRLRAMLLLADDKPLEAVKMLEKACDHVADRALCLQTRVLAATKVRAPALLDAASKDLLGTACAKSAECAATATWLAGLRHERGETGIALGLLARAAREEPNNEARWLKLAEVASEAGAHAQAAEALERVARRHGGADTALRARIDAERSAAMGLTPERR